MNRFIKAKKRFPAEKCHSISSLKRCSTDDDAKEKMFWKNGKINYINELRAHRYLMKTDKILRRVARYNLEKELQKWWRRKPNILKGGLFDEDGHIICNKCHSRENIEFDFCGDGWHMYEYGYICKKCDNKIYHLIRGSHKNFYYFC